MRRCCGGEVLWRCCFGGRWVNCAICCWWLKWIVSYRFWWCCCRFFFKYCDLHAITGNTWHYCRNLSLKIKWVEMWRVNGRLLRYGEHTKKTCDLVQRTPFHKTLPKASEIVNRILVRFYEADCVIKNFSWFFPTWTIKNNSKVFNGVPFSRFLI